jgi:glycosyltransferase involved in cell wall biosynthesis
MPITGGMASVPRVSVVVPAYNLARFLPAALDSALAQDWPADALEVIVVDDGSTDETPAVLAHYAGRVRAIRRPNGGLVAAVDRGLAAVTGDYVALLDADDEWPRDRLRRQVEHLEAHPAVGLVHGDMELIDEHGVTTVPSFDAQRGYVPLRGRLLGPLLAGNFISGGASMVRASLLPALTPIPADAAYPDWWLAANVAAVAEIDHLPGIFNRYRFHGANMGLGADAAKIDRTLAAEVPWRRWMLRHLVPDPSVAPADLLAAYRSWEYGLARGAAAATTAQARELAAVTDAQAAAARRHAHAGARALRAGHADTAARRLLQALGEDPWDGAARLDLELALRALGDAPAAAPQPLVATLPLRARVTLAWAGALLAAPDHLRGYTASVDAQDDATLLILTRSDQELEALVGLVDALGLDADGGADLLAQPVPVTRPARLLLAARADATLGPVPEDWLPESAGQAVAAAA